MSDMPHDSVHLMLCYTSLAAAKSALLRAEHLKSLHTVQRNEIKPNASSATRNQQLEVEKE